MVHTKTEQNHRKNDNTLEQRLYEMYRLCLIYYIFCSVSKKKQLESIEGNLERNDRSQPVKLVHTVYLHLVPGTVPREITIILVEWFKESSNSTRN